MDKHVESRVATLEERMKRMEESLSALECDFRETILGTVDTPGLAHLARETNASVKEIKKSVATHQRFFWLANGVLLTIAAILAIVKALN